MLFGILIMVLLSALLSAFFFAVVVGIPLWFTILMTIPGLLLIFVIIGAKE